MLRLVCAWLFITVFECCGLFLGVAVYYVRRVVPIGACLLVWVSGTSWFSIDGVRGLLPLHTIGFLQRGIAVYSPGLLNLPVRLCRRLLPLSMLRVFVRKLFACIKGAACRCLLPFSHDDGIAVYYDLLRQTCWYIGCLFLIGRLGLSCFITVFTRCLVAVCYRCARWRTC